MTIHELLLEYAGFLRLGPLVSHATSSEEISGRLRVHEQPKLAGPIRNGYIQRRELVEPLEALLRHIRSIAAQAQSPRRGPQSEKDLRSLAEVRTDVEHQGARTADAAKERLRATQVYPGLGRVVDLLDPD